MCNVYYISPSGYLQENNNCPQELPPDFEQLSNGSEPSFVKWKLLPIYKVDAINNRRVWQIGFDGKYIWTLHGTMTATSIDTREVHLNSSGRNLTEQAMLEVANYYKRKIQRGYAPLTSGIVPKLCGMKGVALTEKSKINWKKGMIADTKLDGLRMLCYFNGNKLLMSSNGNESYDHLEHIKEELNEFALYLPPDSTIDGELYNKGMTLPEINSAVRTYKAFNPKSLEISYFIFDLDWAEKPCTEKRYTALKNIYNMYVESRKAQGHTGTYLQLVTKWWVYSYEECMASLKRAVDCGYEGLMLRHPGLNATTEKEKSLSQYRYGSRTTALYKVKNFITEEGRVESVVSGEGREENLGIIQVRDLVSNTLVTIRWGDAAHRASWLQNPQLVIGRIFTYKYAFRHKGSLIPNQPSGIAFRDNYY
jgi:hypothetical protein